MVGVLVNNTFEKIRKEKFVTSLGYHAGSCLKEPKKKPCTFKT